MNRRKKKGEFILFSFLILICLVGKCYMLNNICFDSNAGSMYTLYYSAKFVTSPHLLLLKKNLDTMLIIQLKSIKPLQFPGYNTIYKTEDKEIIVSLLIKQK